MSSSIRVYCVAYDISASIHSFSSFERDKSVLVDMTMRGAANEHSYVGVYQLSPTDLIARLAVQT